MTSFSVELHRREPSSSPLLRRWNPPKWQGRFEKCLIVDEVINRIYRDKQASRDEYIQMLKRLCKRYSGNPNYTLKSLIDRVGYGNFKKGKWDFDVIEINRQIWEAQECRYFSYITELQYQQVNDPYEKTRKKIFFQSVNAWHEDRKYTAVGICGCGKIHRIRKDHISSKENDDKMYKSRCPSCKARERIIIEREIDLQECRRLMREIKSIKR